MIYFTASLSVITEVHRMEEKVIWDKLGSISGLIASVLIPVVIAIVGNEYTTAIKEAENRVKYTEIATEILTSEATKATQNIRGWAIDVLNKHSGVEINEPTRQELLGLSILTEVDSFIRTTYAPYTIEKIVEYLDSDEHWKSLIREGKETDAKNTVKVLLSTVVDEVLDYSEVKKKPLQDLLENSKNDQLEPLKDIRSKMQKLQNE